MVVLGHEGCGAVRAAVAAKAGTPVNAPNALADLVRRIAASLPPRLPEMDEAALGSTMVKHHVSATTRALWQAFHSAGRVAETPAILGAVYDLATGCVEPVDEV